MAKRGCPTLYDPKYNQEMIDYFDIEPYEERIELLSGDKFTKETIKLVPNKLPFISAFARKIGVCTDTLYEWEKVHEDFSETMKKARELQKEFLIHNSLQGLYNSTAFIFTAKNITDMRDKQEIEHSGNVSLSSRMQSLLSEDDNK